jgi:DNA-binding phage protein
MKTGKFKENNFSLEDLEITDWDPAEDFESVEEMRGFLELEFLENNVEYMLDAINTVARAKRLNQIAHQADSLQRKNPSREAINQMLNNIGFLWDNKTMIILE